MTVMAGIELPDTGMPLPEGAPEFAHCDWCKKEDRAALMYHAGNLALFCVDTTACRIRWEEEHAAEKARRIESLRAARCGDPR